MSTCRGRRSPTALVVLAALGPGLLVGCTICPSPYDYAGPVPNGSAPQSDFRARSGGILPIGTAPRPWPTLVQAAEADAPMGVEEPAADEAAVLATAAVAPTVPDADTAADAAPAGADSAPAADQTEPAPVAVAPNAAPALAETPGWRPRRATGASDAGR